MNKKCPPQAHILGTLDPRGWHPSGSRVGGRLLLGVGSGGLQASLLTAGPPCFVFGVENVMSQLSASSPAVLVPPHYGTFL